MIINILSFKKIFLSFIFGVFILNPYTVFGGLAVLLLPLMSVSFLSRFRGLNCEVFFIGLSLILISLLGVFSSVVHGIFQINHFKVAVSIVVYILLAHSIFYIFSRIGLMFDDFIHCILIAVSFNSLIIIFEIYFPSFRQMVESFLVPSGNVDWTEGFRYRGIASGGGASLSVLVPVATVLVLYLYSEKFLNVLSSFIHISILIFSVFFIGRTGLILLPLVALFFVFFNANKYFLKIAVGAVLFGLFAFVFSGNLKQVLVDQYGMGFYNYSVGFLFSGSSGLKEDGTVGIVMEFLTVMPQAFPEVLIGYGFYGGSEFQPWTDSGYSRMFLSVGYVFGLLFYILFFMTFRNVFFYKPFLFLTIGALLLIAEAKEPLIFTGYSARLYISILVIGLLSKRMAYRTNFQANRSLVKVPSPMSAS